MIAKHEEELVACILNEYGDHGPEYVPIIDMYESFTGWYWYITEYDKDDLDVAFGFVHGLEDEWGEIWLPELNKTANVWVVEKKNWPFNSRVKMIPRSELRK